MHGQRWPWRPAPPASKRRSTPCGCTSSDLEGLASSAKRARQLGFQGKMCIYPPQVELVNRAFTPTEKEIAFARRVVAAFEKAEREGSSSIQLDGFFIDYPIVYKAQRTLDAVRATEERDEGSAERPASSARRSGVPRRLLARVQHSLGVRSRILRSRLRLPGCANPRRSFPAAGRRPLRCAGRGWGQACRYRPACP